MSNQRAATRAVSQRTEDEDDSMLRMSFLEHLEEARSRILKALAGVGVAFTCCTWFGGRLWVLVARPATEALRSLGYPPSIIFTTPTEAFLTAWVKMPMLVSIFLAAPWILYQVWAFVAPGLYRRERRWGGPFIIVSAGLFLAGGAFGYFVAFPRGLMFLLGVGKNFNLVPMPAVSDYFDLFVEVMIGLGLVFELPVLLVLLALLRVVTPGFLMRQGRYAVLFIVIFASAITSSPDVFNMLLFAVPMIVLYYAGVMAAWVLVRRRDGGAFGQRRWWLAAGAVVLAGGGLVSLCYGKFHVTSRWPFLRR